MRIFISFLSFLLLPLFSIGAKITFQHLQEGVSNPYVRCILKDNQGFMWFGTNDGLTKYDGTNFKIYEKGAHADFGLLNNTINTLVEDVDDNLWIGTSDGLNRYNRELDRIDHAEFMPDGSFCIQVLYVDKNGFLWIGTLGGGLHVYKPKTKEFISFGIEMGNGLPSNFINEISEDGQGRLWIGTREGIAFYAPNTKSFKHLPFLTADGRAVMDYNVSALALQKNGNFWIGTYGGGLFKLKDTDEVAIVQATKAPFSEKEKILSMCVRQNNELWVGTENGGLTRTNQNEHEYETFVKDPGKQNWLASNSIWSMYEDDIGVLWIGTFDAGVNIVDDSYEKFELFSHNFLSDKSLPDDNVCAFSQDSSGNLWIATDGGGIGFFDTHTREFQNKIHPSLFSSKVSLAVLCSADQHVWSGTWGSGIDRFSPDGKFIKNYRMADSFDPKNNILTIMQDSRRDIWVGTSGGGVLKYNKESDVFEPFVCDPEKKLPSPTAYVSAIYEDSQDRIWVATYFGLLRMDRIGDGEFKINRYLSYDPGMPLSSSRIYSVLEDSKKRIWVGTEFGLNLYDEENDSFTYFFKDDGLPNNSVRSILEDKSGMLWLNTNKGLSKFDTEKRSFTNYTKLDGLNSNELNINACFLTKTGEVFIGGNQGMNAFFPDSIRLNRFIPPVRLTSFMLFNVPADVQDEGSPLKKNITETERIDLEWNQNSFSIKFAALNYTRPSRNKYAYHLDGFDKTWHRTRSIPKATYTNLNPGEYVFKVKGANNDGVWNETPTELVIRIYPPIWKTVWAYILYILVFVTLFLFFIKLLKDKASQKYQLEMDTIRWEQERNLLQLKTNFFTNISHELRTPLSLILSPIQSIVENKQVQGKVLERLQMAYKSVEHLYDLINELMDFSKLEEEQITLKAEKQDVVHFVRDVYSMFADEAQRRAITFELHTDSETLDLWFDKRRLKKVIINLLSNAFKYTPDTGRIELRLQTVKGEQLQDVYQTDKGYLHLSVTDNGPGIAPEYIEKVFERYFQTPEHDEGNRIGTGIGLALVQKLVALHHGKVEVESKKWENTTFNVFLPLGSAHFSLSEIFIPTETQEPERKAKETQAPANTRQQLILVVDDNPKLRTYISSFLEQQYQVVEASDGVEAYELALERKPDLIISDVVMPKRSGTELCAMLKSDKETGHIPIILLSAKADDQSRVDGVSYGADAYLVKPFNENYVLAVVKNLIATRKSLFERFSRDVFIQPNWEIKDEVDKKFIEQIIQYVTENVMTTNITVENLATHLLMNRSSVYRKIKSITDQTATEFIRGVRLKMAIPFIESGQFSIGEVATKVGFDTPGYFTKCFKKQYGRLPSEFLPNQNSE